jgi:hypothetical protein
MSTRARKITELDANTGPSANSLLIIESADGTQKVTVATLLGNSAANVAIRTQTPANSTINVAAGVILYDASYLYIAVANNTLKRVSLTAF